MLTRTDEEAASFERSQAEDIIKAERYPGRSLCRGYPAGHYCIVLIPWTKFPGYCHGCQRRSEEDKASVRLEAFRHPIPTVGEILHDMEPDLLPTCPCGGDAEAPMHEASLLHQSWVLRGKA
jgi:hypothetical protein